MVHVAIACREPLARLLLTRAISALNYPYSLIAPSGRELPAHPPDTVYCVESQLAGELASIPEMTVLVLSGALVSDDLIARLQQRPIVALRLKETTPGSLLRALLSVTVGSGLDDLENRLRRLYFLQAVDTDLVTAFLANPAGMLRLKDLRRARAPLSREGAQALVRAAGYLRAEHLFTALRLATWTVLLETGISRTIVESYLGIHDRGSFRRACTRAGLPAPCRALSSERLGAIPEPAHFSQPAIDVQSMAGGMPQNPEHGSVPVCERGARDRLRA